MTDSPARMRPALPRSLALSERRDRDLDEADARAPSPARQTKATASGQFETGARPLADRAPRRRPRSRAAGGA